MRPRRALRHVVAVAALAFLLTWLVGRSVDASSDWLRGLLLVGLFWLNLNLVDLTSLNLAALRPAPTLPGLRLEAGIPSGQRTLVVVPVLLGHRRELAFLDESLLPSLEANLDDNVVWAVVSASPRPLAELERVRCRRLQRRLGGDRLLYLHRAPQIANWERKRGGYMHLMRWIVTGCDPAGAIPASEAFPAMPAGRVFDVVEGRLDAVRGVTNLLVGDSDTRWPAGTVARLVAKIADPRNRAWVVFQGRTVPHNDSASVLTHLLGSLARASRRQAAARWTMWRRVGFAGHGAGWNVRRFLGDIAGKMRDGYLSHDIVESFFLPTAMVTDVETTEEIPETVASLVAQWRRWWKGNRIASLRLLGPFVRDESGRLVRNRNVEGKLLILESDRHYLVPVLLVVHVALSAAATAAGSLTVSSGPALLYVPLVLLNFHAAPLLSARGAAARARTAALVLCSTVLAHVLMLEVTGLVLRDAMATVWGRLRGRPETHRWIPQSSLAERRGFGDVLRETWGYSLGAGVACSMAAGPLPGSLWFLVVTVACTLGPAPLYVWCAAQRPPRWLAGVTAPRPLEAVGDPGSPRRRGGHRGPCRDPDEQVDPPWRVAVELDAKL